MFELKPAMWSVFLLVPTGRAGMADLPDPADIERVFEDMASLVGKAPFAVKTTEGHHFRRVVMQQNGWRGVPAAAGHALAARHPRWPRRDVHFPYRRSLAERLPADGLRQCESHLIRRKSIASIRLFVSLRDNDALGGKCGLCEYRTRLRRFPVARLRRVWRSVRRRSVLRLSAQAGRRLIQPHP